ncbi:MAG: hypothetical protein L0H94_02240 [Nitrospira sp.]|nr:hypothetical protein [Nitrospira sp.]
MKSSVQIGYRIVVLGLSAGIALSLPAIATSFLAYWVRVKDDKTSLLMMEMAVVLAILLIVLANLIRLSVRDRSLAKMAIGAGLVSFYPNHDRRSRNHIQQLQEKQGTGRTIMVIGYGTLTDQVGDLSSVLERCMGANVLLMNPYSQESRARIGTIADPRYTVELLQDEVRRSIELLKRLRRIGKLVRLKFYEEAPLVKLVILGDYLWLQHYHPDLNVRAMPEYVLRHNLKDHNLHTFYYHYFVQRWGSSEIPEYDLDTDELVFRGPQGIEDRWAIRGKGYNEPGRCANLRTREDHKWQRRGRFR